MKAKFKDLKSAPEKFLPIFCTVKNVKTSASKTHLRKLLINYAEKQLLLAKQKPVPSHSSQSAQCAD